MVSVFLSPSDQLGNTYVVGNTNEAAVCQQISNLLEDKLNKLGVMVDSDPNMYIAVDRSNKMRPDLHLAIHTNASPKHNVRGVRVFYSGSVINKYPADYYLYAIGELDEHTGEIKPYLPERLCRGTDFTVNKEEV